MKDALIELQRWYQANCNGDWEHQYGISITNIDNPGWAVRIDLTDTRFSEAVFEPIKIQRDHVDDWLQMGVVDGALVARGGPLNLREIVTTFLDWSSRVASQK